MDLDKVLEQFNKQEYFQIVSDWNNSFKDSVNHNTKQIVAGSYFKLGDFEECLKICNEIYPFLNKEGAFLSMYGAALRRCGRNEESILLLEKAFEEFPEDSAIANNLANALIDVARYKEAQEILQVFIAKVDPVFNIADINHNMDRINSMLLVEEGAKGKDPNSMSVLNPMVRAFMNDEVEVINGRVSDKINHYLDILPKPNTDTVYQEKLFEVKALIEKEPRISVQYCEELLRSHGPNPLVYSLAGDAYLVLKRYSDAEICYMSSLILQTEPVVSTMMNLSSLAAMRGDVNMSAYWIDRLQHTVPDLPEIKDLKSMLQSRINQKPTCFNI